MRVDLGPVDASSARAFAVYGRLILDRQPGQALSAEIRAAFAGFLSEWEHAARQGGPVRWTHEAGSDEVKYLLHAFYQLVLDVDAGVARRDLPAFPSAAKSFYRTLVRALLDAMTVESTACATWAEELGSFWPGIDPVERWSAPVVTGTR